ncbi:TPA: MFS transporter [Candidatus Poribacteria bacterium]|nr:MFS transporter [Candidatus Poribacteria bacterium]
MNNQDQTDEKAFLIGVINGALWNVVTAVIQPELVLSAFILRLKNSVVLTTLPFVIMRLGNTISSLVISNIAETWSRKKIFYIGGGTFRVIILGFIALATYTIGATSPNLLIWLFLVLLGFYSAGIGSSSIGFNEIIAKTISFRRRGQLMGLRGFFGGLVGIASGFYVRFMLEETGPSFPHNYAYLYATAAFFLGCCVLSFSSINEPAGYANAKRASIYLHIIKGIGIFKADDNFKFQYLNNLAQAMAMIGPVVYLPYAIKSLQVPESFVGSLIILSAGLTLPINFLWSYIGDKYGNRLLLLMNTFVFMLSPVLILLSGYLMQTSLAMVGWNTGLGFITPVLICLILAYAIFTMTNNGGMIGRMNYLLEIAPEARRPSYIAFMNIMLTPTAVFPLIGGVISEDLSFQTNFLLSLIFSLVALYYAYRLGEPRKQKITGNESK